jgi:5'(3')-deoxyribonucleotidase
MVKIVCLQKFLLFINNGIIEYVHFIAPHEEWKYEQFPGIGNRKQVELVFCGREKNLLKINLVITYSCLRPHIIRLLTITNKVLRLKD